MIARDIRLISLQASEQVLTCCHVQFRWLAHGSSQLVDGIGDVVTRALAQEHQKPCDGLVKCTGLRFAC